MSHNLRFRQQSTGGGSLGGNAGNPASTTNTGGLPSTDLDLTQTSDATAADAGQTRVDASQVQQGGTPAQATESTVDTSATPTVESLPDASRGLERRAREARAGFDGLGVVGLLALGFIALSALGALLS